MRCAFDSSVAHDRLVEVHLDYLKHADHDFRNWWKNMTPSLQSARRLQLAQLSRLALIIPTEEDGSHSVAFKKFVDKILRDALVGLSQIQLDQQLDAAQWVPYARTRAQNNDACRKSLARIGQVLSEHHDRIDGTYGGLKPSKQTQQKIAAFKRGVQSLDLWDLIRVRVVAKSLVDVAPLAMVLRTAYGDDVLRLRNYYAEPRTEYDLYRAVHIIAREGMRFVEIQIMTSSREAVCEIDHSIAFKRSLPALGDLHFCWIRRMSLAANVRDAEDAGYRLALTARPGSVTITESGKECS
jgi:ppGpp synthetase/RelA/SpoT-type nucleotidyltranferase